MPKTAVLPNRGAAFPLPLELPLLEPPFEELPVPDGAEVTVPVPWGPASAISDLQVPDGEAEAWVLAEPLKSHAEAWFEPVWAR